MTKPRLRLEAGQRFGKGVVVDPEVRLEHGYANNRAGGTGKYGVRGARLQCDCGNEYVAPIKKLTAGQHKSCGCLFRPYGNLSHTHPLYRTWAGMMARCYRETSPRYDNYGGRGIKVFEAWHDPRNFVAWIEENLGERGSRRSLDRKDVHGDYAPDNVQWAGQYWQSVNKQSSHAEVVSAREERRQQVYEHWQLGEGSVLIAAVLDVPLPVVRRDLGWIGQRIMLLQDMQRCEAPDITEHE